MRTINLTLRLLFLHLRNRIFLVIKHASSHASKKLNIQFTTINQNKLKQTYNSNYVQQVDREREFQELEEALIKCLSCEGWRNNELKKTC